MKKIVYGIAISFAASVAFAETSSEANSASMAVSNPSAMIDDHSKNLYTSGSDRPVIPVNGFASPLPQAQIFGNLEGDTSGKSFLLLTAVENACRQVMYPGDEEREELFIVEESTEVAEMWFTPRQAYADSIDKELKPIVTTYVDTLPANEYLCLGSITVRTSNGARLGLDGLAHEAARFALGLRGYADVVLFTHRSAHAVQQGVETSGIGGTFSPSVMDSGVGGIGSISIGYSATDPTTATSSTFAILARVPHDKGGIPIDLANVIRELNNGMAVSSSGGNGKKAYAANVVK